MLLLKPAVWQSWLKPGVLDRHRRRALLLLVAIVPAAAGAGRRRARSRCCRRSALPVLGAGSAAARAPLTLFNWRYGQLLNFNGLTQSVLLVWPLAAGGVAVRARRPAGVGQPDAERAAAGASL